MKTNETDLYLPVRRYLERKNYSVYAEVKGCDIAAVKNNELVVIELKNSLSLKLIIQGTERQELTDSVYIAVPSGGGKYTSLKNRSVGKLLKRLGLGLMVVRRELDNEIEVVINPSPPPSGTVSRRKREALFKEIGGRYREFNTAGSVSSIETVTAYRLKSVKIAVLLEASGPQSPAMLKKMGAPEDTSSILYNNHYNWFDKVKRGVYALSETGKTGLTNYAEAAEHFRNNLKNL